MGTVNYRKLGLVSRSSQYKTKNLQTGICGPVGGRQKNHATSRPDHLWPEIWSGMSKTAQRKEKQEWAIEKPKLDNARKLRGIYFYRSGRYWVQRNHEESMEQVGIACGIGHALQGPEPPVQEACGKRIRHSQINVCMHPGSSRIYEKAFGKNSA